MVLAVGSAMMSSVQKILQNRALNRVHNFDPVNANKPNVNYNPDGTIHDRLPFPKDLGAYMYDYMSEKEGRRRSKNRRKMTDDDNKDSQKTRSYLSTSSEEEEAGENGGIVGGLAAQAGGYRMGRGCETCKPKLCQDVILVGLCYS